jgi:hypothetical protein
MGLTGGGVQMGRRLPKPGEIFTVRRAARFVASARAV